MGADGVFGASAGPALAMAALMRLTSTNAATAGGGIGGAGSDDADADDVLGTVDADGWWCKARCEDGFLFSRGDGRKVEYDLRPS